MLYWRNLSYILTAITEKIINEIIMKERFKNPLPDSIEPNAVVPALNARTARLRRNLNALLTALRTHVHPVPSVPPVTSLVAPIAVVLERSLHSRNGTDEDDVIDASQLPDDFNKAGDKIYPGKGNDEIINIDGHEVVSSEGNDTYSGQNIKLAFFFDPEAVTVNLLDGTAKDGYGGTDTITGKVFDRFSIGSVIT